MMPVTNRLVLGTTPKSRLYLPPSQNDELGRKERVLGKYRLIKDVAQCVFVKTWCAAVRLEFTYGRLGMTNAQAS